MGEAQPGTCKDAVFRNRKMRQQEAKGPSDAADGPALCVLAEKVRSRT